MTFMSCLAQKVTRFLPLIDSSSLSINSLAFFKMIKEGERERGLPVFFSLTSLNFSLSLLTLSPTLLSSFSLPPHHISLPPSSFSLPSHHLSHSPSLPPSLPLSPSLPRTHLELLQVGPLHADHGGQQLVLQAVAGDGEVDQGALGLQLRLVVGVGQLGLQDQPEAGVVLALLVPDLDAPVRGLDGQ